MMMGLGGSIVVVAVFSASALAADEAGSARPATKASPELYGPRQPEIPRDAPASPRLLRGRATSPRMTVTRGALTSVQVNVDALGNNVVGDAANEPSLAIDPTDPDRMVIGWREFASVLSDFREAGVAYSQDGGQNWTFPGPIEPGVFRSDPVLGADADGNFYYYSLTVLPDFPNFTDFRIHLFKSADGGASWGPRVDGFGGDKQWMTIDRTGGLGHGHIYANWNIQFTCCTNSDFTWSLNTGATFQTPIGIPQPSMKWGTLDVGPDGTLYLAGATLDQRSHVFARSSNASDALATPSFDLITNVDLGGDSVTGGINPAGLLGQVWIATDHSAGPTSGNVYIAGSVHKPSDTNILNVRFIRSTDGGNSWSSPLLVNDDPASGAWHWFGTMSVAPNGRIDMIWNDTRNDPGNSLSEVFYAFSHDGGLTWSANIAVTPSFDPSLGYPQQSKMGDYFHMISDNLGASLAYAATFNGEQDVYFLRIPSDAPPCAQACGDLDDSGGTVNLLDFATFATCFGLSPFSSGSCACSDLNGDGTINLFDFATFATLFGASSSNSPPNCP